MYRADTHRNQRRKQDRRENDNRHVAIHEHTDDQENDVYDQQHNKPVYMKTRYKVLYNFGNARPTDYLSEHTCRSTDKEHSRNAVYRFLGSVHKSSPFDSTVKDKRYQQRESRTHGSKFRRCKFTGIHSPKERHGDKESGNPSCEDFKTLFYIFWSIICRPVSLPGNDRHCSHEKHKQN